jgi:hypothetical protein
MSLFPYNKQKYSSEKNYNGSPIDIEEAHELADKLRYWHGEVAETDDWTKSNDGAEYDIRQLAFGLVAFFAEPSFIHLLMTLGKATIEDCKTIKTLVERNGVDEFTKETWRVIKDVKIVEQ